VDYSVAQEKKSNIINFDTSETMVLTLSLAIEDFLKNGNPNSYLVIIGGAMRGEKPSYNNRRIQQSVGYINHWDKLGDRRDKYRRTNSVWSRKTRNQIRLS
jgi:hypothetical protein